MKDLLSQNIASLRRAKQLTQDELAKLLSVTSQAVSKWENAQSKPDISLLPQLAVVLDTDLNALMGYTQQKSITYYDEVYQEGDYYWGVAPSSACYRVMELLPPTRPLKVLDIACGEGKDAVFFARNGYEVTAFDPVAAGVENAKRLAERFRVPINAFQADMLKFRLDTNFDIIYCSGALHYVPPKLREELLENYKSHTNVGGLHAFNVFVPKPFIGPPPEDEQEFAYPWKSGELFTHYTDWKLHTCEERIFDCDSSNVPHQHCMDVLLAQRIL